MLNNENFKEVLGQSRFAVTLISGEGCANCVSMLPMVLKLKERNDMDVYIVEVSPSNYEINEHYDIKVVEIAMAKQYQKLQVISLKKSLSFTLKRNWKKQEKEQVKNKSFIDDLKKGL